MAGTSSVLEDNTLLSRLDRKLFKIETAMAFTGGLAVFFLILLAVFSVVGRNLFNSPLPGYVDWIEAAMPVIAILGVSYTHRLGGHIRMDILVGALSGRALWIAEFITTLAISAFVICLIWGSWAHFLRSFDLTAPYWSRDSSMDIGLPIWPAKLLVPLALFVLALRLGLHLWGYVRAISSDNDSPVAIPLIEDVATQAAHEAKHVVSHDH